MNLERGLRRIATLLALWSFTSLAITGQLAWATMGVVYGAYAVLLLRRNLLLKIGTNVWRLGNVVFLPVFSTLAYHDLGNALVYLTSYLQIQQLVRVKHPRDYAWLFAVSYFQMVLAGAISSELSFVVVILGFLALSVLAVVMLGLERARRESDQRAGELTGVGEPLEGLPGAAAGRLGGGGAPRDGGYLPRRSLLRLSGVCVLVAMVSAFFFVTIPRLAARKTFMRLRAFDNPAMTGFTESVGIDSAGGIYRDRTPVLWVWLDSRGSELMIPSALRLRGLALDWFDGLKWGSSPRSPNQLGPTQLRPKWTEDQVRIPFVYDKGNQVRLHVTQDMRQTSYLFGPPFVYELDSEGYGLVRYFPEASAFRMERPYPERIEYRVHSVLEPSASNIAARVASVQRLGGDAAGVWKMAEKARKFYTNVTDSLPEKPRMQKLAEEMTRGAGTQLERVQRLNRFFHEQFTYSLEAQDSGRGHQMVHFLFRRREGHCEKFASAMAVLCRLIDIPARVVTGYYTTELNRYQKFFLVRQSNAHSWVEVWLDGYGWMTVDPTPPTALSNRDSRFAFLNVLSDFWESWTVLWRRYIMDYSLIDQGMLFARMRALLAARGHSLTSSDGPKWMDPRSWFRTDPDAAREGGFVFHKLSVAGLVVLWVVYRRQQKRHNGGRTRGREPNRSCPVRFYAEILALLGREGWQRRPDQTPADFARTIGAARPDLAELLPLTEIYYRIRYSGALLEPDDERRAMTLLTQLARTSPRRPWSRLAPHTAA